MGTMCGEDCVDTNTDLAHCGACDAACGENQGCDAGSCVCTMGTESCGDACVDTQSDPLHCGACDNVCPDGWLCSLGECALDCDMGLQACGDSCVDLQTDPLYCGDCDTACVGEEVCTDGACECPNEGDVTCNDVCVDTQTDPLNCGGCDVACGDGEVCNAGACECDVGLELCDGACVDTQTDAMNCGACGMDCGGAECVDGQCTCGTDCFGDAGCLTDGGECIRFACRAGNAGANFCDSCMGWFEVTYENWLQDGWCSDVTTKYRADYGHQTMCGNAPSCCANANDCDGGDNAWHFVNGNNQNFFTGPCLGCQGNMNCTHWNNQYTGTYTRLSVCRRF